MFVKGWRALSESSYTTTGFSSPSGCEFWQAAAATYPRYFSSFASHSNADSDLSSGQTHPLEIVNRLRRLELQPEGSQIYCFLLYICPAARDFTVNTAVWCQCLQFASYLSVDLFFKAWSCRVIQDGTHNPLALASQGLGLQASTHTRLIFHDFICLLVLKVLSPSR